jgi:hypothetical protein
MKPIKIFLLYILSLSFLCSCSENMYTHRRTSEYKKFKIPNLHLGYFSKDKKDILLDYLSKSSEWHVYPAYSTIIANKRKKHSCKNRVPELTLNPSRYPNNLLPVLGVNFIDLYPDTNKFPKNTNNKGINTEIEVVEGSDITLNKWRTGKSENSSDSLIYDMNFFTAYLTVKSNDKKLTLHAFNSSQNNIGSSITSFLNSTSEELRRLAKYSEKNQPIDLSILPSESIITSSRQVVNIDMLGAGGDHNVYGYINPMQKGFIYLKIIRKDTNKVIRFDKEGSNAEYVGWSSDANQKFNFCIGAHLRGYNEDIRPVLTEFQLWFQPSDNTPEHMLYTKTLSTQFELK